MMGCNYNSTLHQTHTSYKLNNNIVGNERDTHGCISSAGYQWSELQQQCIRSFELPLQLLNQEKTFGAYVFFTADTSKAEVFSKEGNSVLIKNTANEFIPQSKSSYDIILKKINNSWILEMPNDKIFYKEEKKH